MRPPRPLLLAALAALIAAPVLNGCANSAQDNGTIAGADTAAASPSSSSSAAAPASIPSDLTLDLQMTATGDAAKDALLTKTKSLVYAFEQAVARANPNDGLYQTMVSGAGSTAVYAQIEQFAQAGQRPIGVIRFYGFTVLQRAPAADVMFCEDTSQTQLLNTKSGATTEPAAGNGTQSYWDVGYLTLGGKSTIESVAIRPGGSACTG